MTSNRVSVCHRVAPNNYADKDWTWVPISEHHPLSGCYHQQYVREMRSVIGKLSKRVRASCRHAMRLMDEHIPGKNMHRSHINRTVAWGCS